jgi:hypothetical protein
MQFCMGVKLGEKLSRNTSSGSRADTRGQTNKHDEANMRFWRLKQIHLKLHTLMELQGSLSCQQELGIGLYNEPD